MSLMDAILRKYLFLFLLICNSVLIIKQKFFSFSYVSVSVHEGNSFQNLISNHHVVVAFVVKESSEAKNCCPFFLLVSANAEAVEQTYFLEFGNRDVFNVMLLEVVTGEHGDWRNLIVGLGAFSAKLIQSEGFNAS